MSNVKPSKKPVNPSFSSGPCAKRPGWSSDILSDSLAGRSHRSSPSKKQLKYLIDKHREILGIPEDYRIAITAGSDTGAFELAMWNIIGTNESGTDVLVWESFSNDWCKDIKDQLKPSNVREFKADYGDIPDLNQVNFDHDVVFVWNGTTSGVRVPDGDWIDDNRKGLVLCDATSAVFAYEVPWRNLDVVTWSWQKAIGGEGGHGMLVLSPRAAERISNCSVDRPLPKIFRIKKGDGLNEGVFEGLTINTPSMLAVADCIDALEWLDSLGGLQAGIERTEKNFETIEKWVKQRDWIDFLPEKKECISKTSVCLKIVDPEFLALDEGEKKKKIKSLTSLLESEDVAYDIASYRDAPTGLRIWCGTTIESSDLKILTSWLDWGYEQVK